MNKKVLLAIFSVIISFSFVSPVSALDLNLPDQVTSVIEQKEAVKEEVKGIVQGVLEEKKELFKDIKGDIKDLKKDSREAKKLNKVIAGKVLNGVVKSKDGSNFTVEKNGKSVMIQTDGNTKFTRHFWGNTSLAEIAVGDKVNIYGKYVDEGKTTLLAKLVRDLSIMKRFGVFVGTVVDLNGNTFTLNAVARGTQKVTLNDSTKCVNLKEESISCSDVQNNHRVRVKGIWNKTANTITEIQHLKDYSLPVK